MKFRETDQSWISQESGVLERLCLDWAVGLTVSSRIGKSTISIECPFQLRLGEGVHHADPGGESRRLGILAELVRGGIESIEAMTGGELEIHFTDDIVLFVPVDPDHEAWNLVDESGFKLVSNPAGGLTVWLEQQQDSFE